MQLSTLDKAFPHHLSFENSPVSGKVSPNDSHLLDAGSKRTAWVLYEMEGMAPAEIAEVLELPLNTVRSRILSARREILGALSDGEETP